MAKTKGSDIGMALLKNTIPPLYGVIVCFREIYLMLSGRPSEFNEPSSSSGNTSTPETPGTKEYPSLPNNNPHTEWIKRWDGKLLAQIEIKNNGEQWIRNFSGKILGWYDPKSNYTRDFSGRILSQGNTLTRLIDEK